MRSTSQSADPTTPVQLIERQAAVLVRNFELLNRRLDFHDDLDRAGYLLLRTLVEEGRMDIRSLADTLGLDPSTAGRQVAVMEREGLVERHCAPPDRRRAVISPTRKGLERVEKVRCRRTEGFAELLRGWDEGDLRTLGEMFERYNRCVAQRLLADEDPHPPGGAAASL